MGDFGEVGGMFAEDGSVRSLLQQKGYAFGYGSSAEQRISQQFRTRELKSLTDVEMGKKRGRQHAVINQTAAQEVDEEKLIAAQIREEEEEEMGWLDDFLGSLPALTASQKAMLRKETLAAVKEQFFTIHGRHRARASRNTIENLLPPHINAAREVALARIEFVNRVNLERIKQEVLKKIFNDDSQNQTKRAMWFTKLQQGIQKAVKQQDEKGNDITKVKRKVKGAGSEMNLRAMMDSTGSSVMNLTSAGSGAVGDLTGRSGILMGSDLKTSDAMLKFAVSSAAELPEGGRAFAPSDVADGRSLITPNVGDQETLQLALPLHKLSEPSELIPNRPVISKEDEADEEVANVSRGSLAPPGSPHYGIVHKGNGRSASVGADGMIRSDSAATGGGGGGGGSSTTAPSPALSHSGSKGPKAAWSDAGGPNNRGRRTAIVKQTTTADEAKTLIKAAEQDLTSKFNAKVAYVKDASVPPEISNDMDSLRKRFDEVRRKIRGDSIRAHRQLDDQIIPEGHFERARNIPSIARHSAPEWLTDTIDAMRQEMRLKAAAALAAKNPSTSTPEKKGNRPAAVNTVSSPSTVATSPTNAKNSPLVAISPKSTKSAGSGNKSLVTSPTNPSPKKQLQSPGPSDIERKQLVQTDLQVRLEDIIVAKEAAASEKRTFIPKITAHLTGSSDLEKLLAVEPSPRAPTLPHDAPTLRRLMSNDSVVSVHKATTPPPKKQPLLKQVKEEVVPPKATPKTPTPPPPHDPTPSPPPPAAPASVASSRTSVSRSESAMSMTKDTAFSKDKPSKRTVHDPKVDQKEEEKPKTIISRKQSTSTILLPGGGESAPSEDMALRLPFRPILDSEVEGGVNMGVSKEVKEVVAEAKKKVAAEIAAELKKSTAASVSSATTPSPVPKSISTPSPVPKTLTSPSPMTVSSPTPTPLVPSTTSSAPAPPPAAPLPPKPSSASSIARRRQQKKEMMSEEKLGSKPIAPIKTKDEEEHISSDDGDASTGSEDDSSDDDGPRRRISSAKKKKKVHVVKQTPTKNVVPSLPLDAARPGSSHRTPSGARETPSSIRRRESLNSVGSQDLTTQSRPLYTNDDDQYLAHSREMDRVFQRSQDLADKRKKPTTPLVAKESPRDRLPPVPPPRQQSNTFAPPDEIYRVQPKPIVVYAKGGLDASEFLDPRVAESMRQELGSAEDFREIRPPSFRAVRPRGGVGSRGSPRTAFQPPPNAQETPGPGSYEVQPKWGVGSLAPVWGAPPGLQMVDSSPPPSARRSAEGGGRMGSARKAGGGAGGGGGGGSFTMQDGRLGSGGWKADDTDSWKKHPVYANLLDENGKSVAAAAAGAGDVK